MKFNQRIEASSGIHQTHLTKPNIIDEVFGCVLVPGLAFECQTEVEEMELDLRSQLKLRDK
jgi:hypothetical protein